MAIFGEIQLLFSLIFIALIYRVDEKIELYPEAHPIPEPLVETKTELGWYVIALFLL